MAPPAGLSTLNKVVKVYVVIMVALVGYYYQV